MSEPFKVKLPLRMNGYEFNLMAQTFNLLGIDIEKALEVEKQVIGFRGYKLFTYIIHGPKRV